MAGRRPTPEKAFQSKLVAALHSRGYIVDHTYQLRTDDGSWRTGSTLKGKPDLLALRPPRLLAIEVKADGGRLRPDQQAVLSYFAGIPNARAWVLCPSDPWGEILEWLDRPKDAPRVYGFDLLELLDAFRVVATASQRKAR
ncbi:MAG TPA: VRR-NUC domain-containing protein [Iamia sp.]|nr:VRR-NUC domain-containing protein [Iamia sp.]